MVLGTLPNTNTTLGRNDPANLVLDECYSAVDEYVNRLRSSVSPCPPR